MDEFSWGLSIDIEGFSSNFEFSKDSRSRSISSLRELMEAILRIGRDVYPGKGRFLSERLFAHQFGDGFVITSYGDKDDFERCIAISISLMRHMMIKGYATKAAVSIGSMIGINSFYPDGIGCSNSGNVSLGHGLMTTVPVTGTALIRTYRILSKGKGAVLLFDENRIGNLPKDIVINKGKKVSSINWFMSELPLSKEISEKASLEYGDKDSLIRAFESYIGIKPVPPEEWIQSTRSSFAWK